MSLHMATMFYFTFYDCLIVQDENVSIGIPEAIQIAFIIMLIETNKKKAFDN